MLDKSATHSFLPGGAMMQPRMQSAVACMMLSIMSGAAPVFSASIAISCAASSNPLDGLGMLPGWNSRCASRPVREAPQNCVVLRRRPSLDVALTRALYLAVLVLVASRRRASSNLTGSGNSGSSSRRRSVSARMSGRLTPYSIRMCTSSSSRLDGELTAPSVRSWTSALMRACSSATADIAAPARPTSTAKPRSLIR